MKLDILGGNYKDKYIDLNPQRTINWMPSISSQSEKSRNQMSLKPTPGLSLYCSIAGRYNRGGVMARSGVYNRCFVVVDQTLWEINPNQTATNRGTLTNIPYGSTPVWLKVNLNGQLYIGHYMAAYVFNLTTNTLTQITDVNYPTQILYADYIDGYGFVVSANGFVYFCVVGDWTNWTPAGGSLQVFAPTFKAAAPIASVAFRDKIFIFTSETIEPYYEDASTAIFARYPATIYYTGLLHSRVVSVFDDGIIFLGRSPIGDTFVYMITSEYSAVEPISQKDPSIQWLINNNYQALREAYTFVQRNKEGHTLFHLTIPDLKTTLCYDTSTGMWFEKQSLNPSLDSDGSPQYNVYRGNNIIDFNGTNLVQDVYSGNVLYEDYTNQTEYNTSVKRTRISQAFIEDYKLISTSNFELDATKGSGNTTTIDPVMMLYTSTDGGHSYSQPRNLLLGEQGDYLYRSRLQKLGSGRIWVLKLELTDPVDIMVQAAFASGVIGAF